MRHVIAIPGNVTVRPRMLALAGLHAADRVLPELTRLARLSRSRTELSMRLMMVALLLMLAGCSLSAWNERISSPEDRALALRTITGLRSGKLDALKADMEPTVFAQTVAGRHAFDVPLSTPGTPVLVTANSNTVSDGNGTVTTKALNYEFGAGKRWVVMQIVLRSTAKGREVIGWNVTSANARPTSIGNFSFSGKGPIHFVWIAAMIASTLTILVAFVQGFRSKGIKRRWLWMLGSALGLGRFSLNWATGAWSIQPIYVSLLGGSFIRPSPFEPWILSFSLPIVAVISLLRRRSLITERLEQAL
jgi:hypothetical protein